jgi:glutathione S-transferase
MKLFHTHNSPYARRPRLVAHELGLVGTRVDEVDVSPRDAPDSPVNKFGPGGKVPALLTDDGAFLIESIIITHYLDAIGGNKLVPQSGAARGAVIAVEGLASMLMDSLYLRRHELARPVNEQSPGEIEKEAERAQKTYDALEAKVSGFGSAIDIGQLTAIASLGYADWRHPGDEWRKGRPALTSWFESLASRPSVATTKPIF